MADQIVIQWDATTLPAEVRALLPDELRGLPPGRYLIEPLLDDEELTSDEELGLLLAMQEIEAGQGIPWEQVHAELRSRADDSHAMGDSLASVEGPQVGLGALVPGPDRLAGDLILGRRVSEDSPCRGLIGAADPRDLDHYPLIWVVATGSGVPLLGHAPAAE